MQNFKHLVEWTALAVDALGVVAVLVGILAGSVSYLRRFAGRADQQASFRVYRNQLGRAILLGLEFFVAGDIIRTVAIDPTMDRVLVLGLIVLIRTFLSFALQVELEGHWPWQQSNRSDRRGIHDLDER